MNKPGSLLDELRVRYEALPESTDDHGDVESFQAIDARLREAFRWLEKAITYLNGLKPPIEHRFDLGYGYVFDSPRFAHGSVGQHERRIVGFPVLEAIDVYYEVSAAKPLSIEVVPGWVSFAEKTLDAFGLQYTSRRIEDSDGTLRKCIFSVPPVIPARVSFRVDYRTGIVTVALVNVDRLERVTLEFPSTAIEEPVLEDLVRLILGRDSAFLKRGRLAGLHGRSLGLARSMRRRAEARSIWFAAMSKLAPRCMARTSSPRARSAIVIAAIAFVLTGCATTLMPTPVLYTGENARPLFTESVDRQSPAASRSAVHHRSRTGRASR